MAEFWTEGKPIDVTAAATDIITTTVITTMDTTTTATATATTATPITTTTAPAAPSKGVPAIPPSGRLKSWAERPLAEL